MAQKIIIACGGTGGHSFPGLAVAKNLAARGHYVIVWSSGRTIEDTVMKYWNGPMFSTGARPLSAKNFFANALSVIRCRREMSRERPDALLAMGSYASLPPVIAAASKHIPIALHEANTVPGRAVDYLSRFAKVIAISFDETADYLAGRHLEKTGLPVREEIFGQPRLDEVPPNAFTVFVTGGSQGAHRVNEITSAALALVQADIAKRKIPRPLYVIHQTGAADEAMISALYMAKGIPARVKAFEREMGRAFTTADVVIARAGASTCFELARVGKPAFFIPLPSAMRNHQHFNAEAFVRAGAACEGLQDTLTPRALANWILNKMEHPETLEALSKKMLALSTPNAAARVADIVEMLSAKRLRNGDSPDGFTNEREEQ